MVDILITSSFAGYYSSVGSESTSSCTDVGLENIRLLPLSSPYLDTIQQRVLFGRDEYHSMHKVAPIIVVRRGTAKTYGHQSCVQR